MIEFQFFGQRVLVDYKQFPSIYNWYIKVTMQEKVRC